MGRPLKISKLNATVTVDLGFPNDGTTDNGFSDTAPGVYGGTINDFNGELALYPAVAVEEAQQGTINSTAGITVIWSASDVFDGSETVAVNSVIYAAGVDDALGVVNTINTPVTVTIDASTAGATDSFTTKGAVAATALVENGPVVLSTDYAGLTGGTVYYVKTIVDSTHFTVSATPGGAKLDLTAETNDITAEQYHSITLDAAATATVTNSAWTAATPDTGWILRQKGKKKFLIARRQTINDEFIAAGGSYIIISASNTDWAALGAGPDAAAGKIFTATVDGAGLTTDGTVYPVSICTLVEAAQADLVRNQMSLTLTKGDSSTEYAASVTNHFAVDFTDNGTDENAGAKYIATFLGANSTPDDATDLEFVSVQNND